MLWKDVSPASHMESCPSVSTLKSRGIFRGLVDQPYEEMVANFMARFLDIDLSKVTGRGAMSSAKLSRCVS